VPNGSSKGGGEVAGEEVAGLANDETTPGLERIIRPSEGRICAPDGKALAADGKAVAHEGRTAAGEEPAPVCDEKALVGDGQAMTSARQAPDSVLEAQAGAAEEEMPRVLLTRRQVVAFGLFILSSVGFLYFVLPHLAGVGTTVHRIEGGDIWWIAVGVILELLSFAGYVVLFRAVFVRGHELIGWRESYQITMAGLAATRLFATAGAGGIALTAWAVRRSGMEPRLVACRMVAFLVLLYVVYAGSLLIDGIGLGIGLFPGGGSFAITIVPAIVAAVLLAAVGAMALLPGDLERRLGRWASGSGRRWRGSNSSMTGR